MAGGGGTVNVSEQRVSSLRVQTSAYGLPIPIVYGHQRITANMMWYGDFASAAQTSSAGGKGGGGGVSNTTYTYSASTAFALCEGVIGGVGLIWKGKELITDNGETPAERLDFSVFDGAQIAAWEWLTSMHADEALTYPNLAYVAISQAQLGSSPSFENHSFEVYGKYSYSSTLPDADPAQIVYDLLTNPVHGAGYPADKIGDLSDFSDYCFATGMLISPALTEQRAAHEIIKELVESVNCAVVPTGGKIKIVPYGDEITTGNGVTFTPDLTPVYDLTDDDFIGDDEPVKVRRRRDADAFNRVQIEFTNRANQYNAETIEAKDQANIELYGLRSEDPRKAPWFCTADSAQHAAQLRLQRLLYIRNEYEFELGWKYCLLEPMDIVTLTDSGLGLNQYPVRIKEVAESADGLLSIVAEELVVGASSAARYNIQSSAGYQGQNGDPGNVFAPVIFEPPLDLTGGKNEVWCAVAGGVDWGGCDIWASFDNATYQRIGTLFGAARYGVVVGAVEPSDTSMTVELNTDQQLLSGTSLDADTNQTLCLVNNEFINYESSMLGTGQYLLGELRRGVYGGATSHAAGSTFVRVDRAIFKHPIDNLGMIGQTLYVKFLSFNGLGQRQQLLPDVTAYSYLLQGGMPSGVSGLSLQSPWVGTSFTVQWAAVTGSTSYTVEVRNGALVLRSVSVAAPLFTYTLEDAIADGLSRGYTVRVAAVADGQASGFASIDVLNPKPTPPANITSTSTLSTITLSWDAVAVPDLDGYQVWLSTSSSFDPDVTSPTWVGTATETTFTGLTPATTYYLRVAARDVWGGVSWDYSALITKATSA